MNFLEDFNSLSVLLDSNKTWKLLRADNAPFILSFLKNIFKDEREVAFDDVRANLKEFLEEYRFQEKIVSDRSASDYLREWIDKGWLNEMDNNVIMTDASQKALNFCEVMKDKLVSTSATHLQILQNEIQQLCIEIGTDKSTKIKSLAKQRDALNERIKIINAGKDKSLTEAEKKEHIRTIYDLARRLPNDFRKLEEETRDIDRSIRIKMIENNSTKGNVLEEVLKEEKRQRKTEYGAAYDGFFKMLCDHDTMISFKSQVDYLLSQPIAKYLTKEQGLFLHNLVDVLVKECDRVKKVRARIDENLRMYIESSDFQENKIINKLLSSLEKVGVTFKKANVNMRSELDLVIETGSVKVVSPMSMTLKTIEEIPDYSEVQENTNSSTINDNILRHLDSVRLSEVRNSIVRTLGSTSQMSVAEIIKKNTVRYGLQEVVTFVRVANEFKADMVDGEIDVVEVKDYRKPNVVLKVTIPRQILSSQHIRNSIKDNGIDNQ